MAGSPSEFTLNRSPNGLSHARRLLEEGKPSEAKAIFAGELKRAPKSVEAIRGLALCARDEGDDETALQRFQELTALAPKDLAGWRQQALAAARLGRDMEALTAAQAALSLAPQGDRAMSDLMTRVLSAETNALANPMKAGIAQSWNPEHSVRGNSSSTFDPLTEIPLPEPPDPARGLPGVSRGK